MPSVVSVGTALPRYSYSLDDVLSVGQSWLRDQPHNLELFQKFLHSSKTQRRNFIFPISEMLSTRGLEERARIFEECAAPLGIQACQQALEPLSNSKSDISTLIFTSCSCPSIPSVDALIVEGMGFKRTINRLPIFQQGCAGGVVGLRFASELCKTQGLVSVVSVELCSLVFQKDNSAGAQLVGAAIFADGAACAVVSPQEKGLVIRGTQSFLIPESRHLMGYDIFDDGFHLRLDRNLPQALTNSAPDIIRKFLLSYDLKDTDVPYWLFHPGGTRILDFLEAEFSLRPDQAYWARHILTNVGNLSSATVLFVLNEFIKSKVYRNGDKILMVGVGPGLTIELILFEWVE